MSEQLHQRLQALERENAELRATLARFDQQSAQAADARKTLLRGGGRFLVPLLDRQKVVRSFGKLLETVSGFSGSRSEWPARDQVLADGRLFLEAVVRFLIRRRMLVALFSVLALAIPAFQLWLAVQQNRIAENQTKMFEIQMYDVVARTLTEGDRNARAMTGALLARADTEFLKSVLRETFDPTLGEVYRDEGVDAVQRRLEDAAHRGYLIRALDRSIQLRARDASDSELYESLAGPSALILSDAAARIPAVMRLGRGGQVNSALAEQVDNYVVHVGHLMATDARVSRQAGERDEFYDRVRPLFQRLASVSSDSNNAFAIAYRTMLQDFLIDLALEPEVGEPARMEGSPEHVIARGLGKLREGVGGNMDWGRISAVVSAR